MKTLHTIYTNFAKRLAMVSILLTYIGVAAAWGETLTLSNLGKNISTASNDVKTTTIVATGDNTETYTINYKQCSQNSNNGNYAMFLKKGAGPFISNKTPIPGNITSVTIYILTGASSSTSYHCAFSTTECTSVYTNGSTAQTISAGASHKYECEVDNARYFCISLGNNSNGQVWKIDVEYEVVSGSSYTVNWYVNNSLLHTQTDVVGTVLSSMPTPTKLDCDNEKVFVGWTTSAYSHATTAPSTLITNTSGMTIPEGGADYHAVFAKPNPNGTEQRTVTLSPPETENATYKEGTQLDSENNIWTYYATINNEYGNICFGLNSNENNYNIGSPVFGGNVTSVSFKAHNGSTTESRKFLFCSSNSTAKPQSGDLAEVTIPKGGSSFNHTIYTADLTQSNVSQFYIYVSEALRITDISVTYKCAYSNYTTNCAEIITYNVIYEANDKTSGTVPVDNNEYESGETVTVKSHGDLAKIGYTFAGWKRSDNSDIVQDNNTITMPASDLTLIAQWNAKPLTNFRTLCTYEIILDKNGGTTDGSALVPATKTALTAINPPVYTGYQIAGYYYEPECNTLVADIEGNLQPNTPYTNAHGGWTAGEVTLYPKWEALEYTVTWKVGGESFATSTVSATQALALPVPAPADDALGCCAEKFIGWSTSTTPTKAQVFSDLANAPAITGDQTFHAVFATPVPGAGNSLVTFNEMGYANEEAVTSVTLGDGLGNGDATITFAKGAATTYSPIYYNIGEAVRTYAGNTITVAATYANTVLTQIDFAFAKGENANEITASTGTITDGVWIGNAQSVTFTIGGATGHRRIASIAITTAVTGDQYTNYVTKCDLSGSASIGAGTITYTVGNAIEVKCGQRSPASKAATLTFAAAQNLTCPVTIEATTGFLVSTNRNDNSKYASSIIVKPVKTGTNKGKLPTIYVRYEANFGATGQIHGTISATGSEIEDTGVAVLANVTCTQYTLTVVDHLGNTISTTNYYEGNEVAKVAPPTPDDCSKNYTFDGWSTTEVEYGSLVYNKVSFPFVMPAEDVTLYPVYQVNKSADYHRVTKELGVNNWEGQYLIAFSNTVFADGNKGGTDAEAIGDSGHFMNPGTNLVDDVVKANWGDSYNVKLVAVDGGYVMQTKDNKYNYITNNSSQGNTISTSLDKSTAAKYPLAVVFKNDFDIEIKNPNNGAVFHCGSFFRFYLNSTHYPIYLYKKSPLYTTPLICGTIEVADAVVTSTAGQTIKVNVPVTLTSDLTQPNTIEKAISDNPNFSVTALENAGQHTIAIGYTPTATTDGTETANITLTASNNATTTFQVTGRHLPENFVIAAKWGDNWYVLPADMNSESITEGLLIEVDDPADPTKAKAAPNTTKYGLKSVYTSNGSQDRYATHGERLVFVENVDETTPVANQTLYNGGGDAQNSTNTNIQVNAQYKTATSGYYETHPNRYEWIPTTTDLKDYTLTSAHTFATEAARTVSLDNHGIFGTLLQDKSYNGMVRLLPVDNFYETVELQVVEWKQYSVSVMYTGAGTKYTIKVGNNAESSLQALPAIDHAVYSLSTSDLTTAADLTTATNQPLIITIKDDADAIIGAVKLTIPAIVATDKTSTALGVTEENAKATSIVVLDGATLTADATKYTYDDITVYPGGNLIIDNGKSLGMYTLTLRVGSSWGAVEYEHKYPQFLLRGDYSNTSAQINLDYVTTQDYYYPLSVPEEVTIGDIKYPVDIYGNNVEKANKGSFQLKRYDGAQRATGATGWVVLDEKNITKLSPNSGYAFWGIPKKVSVNGAAGVRQTYGIHRIPIKIAADKLLEHEKINEEITIQAYAAARPNDQGWNYLGNPYLAGLGGMNGSDEDLLIGLLEKEIVDGQWTGGWVYNEESVNNKVRYITITNDCQNFEALPVANAKISPFTTFFIQAASVDDQKIRLTVPASILNVSSLPARHYAAQQVTAKEITTGIILTGNDQTDRTGLLIADNFTEEYDFNADLSKFENSGINLYTIGKTGNLAYMAINQALAEQPIPVGYSAPAEGLYTIAFDEDRYNATDISALYLIDYDSNEKTNLLHTDYSFVTAAGTNNQRFALQVAFAPENATNVEWVGNATIQVGVEGHELILHNLPTDAAVHVFDALGRLMYHTPHAPTEMQLTLPTGYYLVRIADKQHAAVINTVIP